MKQGVSFFWVVKRLRSEKPENASRIPHRYLDVGLQGNLRTRKCRLSFKENASYGLVPDSLCLVNAAHGVGVRLKVVGRKGGILNFEIVLLEEVYK